jgi:DNA-directed RNA polymerase specialized sigma24 family protein
MKSSPLDEPLATRLAAFQILDRLDSIRITRSPTVLTVFRLYCLQRMTVSQVARRCRCSVGTVSNRLRLMQSKIGVHPSTIKNAARPLPDNPAVAEQAAPKIFGVQI